MLNEHYIVIVDDEAANRKLLERFLKNDYSTLSFDSGEACLASMRHDISCTFLLDVRMPGGMDGFELCERIREQPQFQDSVIFFLSAMDSVDEKMKGYEAGADDYIVKPIELPELQVKIKQAIEYRQQLASQYEQTQNAMQIAMTSMTNSGEIGELNNFLNNLQHQKSYESLCEHTLTTLQNFELNAVLQIRTKNEDITQSTSGKVNEIEERLMAQAEGLGRIYSFGNRCLFNFDQASILVRRMPDDEDKAGRYRDHLASLLNGVEARMQSLATELILEQQKQHSVVKALNLTHQSLSEILADLKSHDVKVSGLFEYMSEEMDMAFSYLDLNEEQEEYLKEIFIKNKTKINTLLNNAHQIEQKFESLSEQLKSTLS
ncbi:response regulator [Thalassotalea sp. G2M2-11]|uniref:response regulator n=1 Tax=Thalassotalea sp. G2M2-11 TaxID=2787627 RepID=UPI0019CFDF9E